MTTAMMIAITASTKDVVTVALFAISWVMRRGNPAAPRAIAILLGIIALVLALIAAGTNWFTVSAWASISTRT